MGKKRARDSGSKASASRPEPMDRDDGSSSDEEDFDIVNVEFEWFNFDADVDFHGTKTLLRQLLDVDATLFDISALADLVLAQPTIGSTVKVDGKATDAYALLTALSLRELQDKPAVAALTQYLAGKAGQASGPKSLAQVLPGLLPGAAAEPSSAGTKPHVGLVLSERFINMPAEIAPPLFSMLIDELEAAVEDGEPYDFTHYLVLSKTYQEVASDLGMMVVDGDDDDDDDDSDDDKKTKGKKGKRKRARSSAGGAFAAPSSLQASSPNYYFHPEDEVLQKHALAYGTYPFTKESEAVADSKRAFQELGVKAQGLMILIEASKFPGAVKAINDYITPPQV